MRGSIHKRDLKKKGAVRWDAMWRSGAPFEDRIVAQ